MVADRQAVVAVIPRHPPQYVEVARRHGIKAETLSYGISIACPVCANGQQVIIEDFAGTPLGECNCCGATAAAIALELDTIDRRNGKATSKTLGPAPGQVFRLYTPAQLLDFPDPEWLVEPFIVDGCFSILYGSSGSFKSFLALDWAAHAAGPAVYISAEGSPKRLGERIAAWEHAAGRPSGIICIPHAVDLIGEAEALSAAIRELPEPIRLIVVDTASRNMAGADENSTKDMSALVASLDKLRAEFGTAVLAIHHTGHENKERERGSSALRAAADVSIFARRGDTPLTVRLKCAKVRDAAEFAPSVVRLEPTAGTLVAAAAVTAAEAVEQAVRDHLAKYPDASQNDVEKAVTGKSDDIRAAYRRVRPSAPHPRGAPPDKVRPKASPLKGAQGAVPQTLDDGGW
jgi:hypothetical protein